MRPAAPAAAAASSRLFFALWPPPAVAHALHTLARDVAAQHGGRIMRVDTLHVTMAFLGDTPNERIAAFAAIGAACARASTPFDLALDHLGYWSRKHIAWVGPRSVPPALVQLAEALVDALGDAVSDRRFSPHVTLLRKAGGSPELPVPTLSWRVDALHLVRSVTTPAGAQYVTVGCWPLGE